MGTRHSGGKVAAKVTGALSLDEGLRDLTGDVTWTWPVRARTCDLVLDVVANTPTTAANGTWVAVDAVDVGGAAVAVHPDASMPAGARTSRLVGKLPNCLDAGSALTVDVRFRAHAGAGGNERIGARRSGAAVSWWGSVIPRPARQTKDGWFSPVVVWHKGEAEVSETFDIVDLDVLTPAWATLAAQGVQRRPSSAAGGRQSWRVNANPVRDVAFVVGDLIEARAGQDGCQARAVAPARSGISVTRVAAEAAHALSVLKDTFLFCPYATTTVAAVQDGYGGMEFPGLVVISEHDPLTSPRLVAHEIGHQYFYGWNGSDPGRHPWLDEAFATWAESLVNPETAADLRARSWPPGSAKVVGKPMEYFNDHPDDYSSGVYARGAAAIIEARDAAGAKKFDTAMRDWLAECGLRICGPDDLLAALKHAAPAAIPALKDAGAF